MSRSSSSSSSGGVGAPDRGRRCRGVDITGTHATASVVVPPWLVRPGHTSACLRLRGTSDDGRHRRNAAEQGTTSFPAGLISILEVAEMMMVAGKVVTLALAADDGDDGDGSGPCVLWWPPVGRKHRLFVTLLAAVVGPCFSFPPSTSSF